MHPAFVSCYLSETAMLSYMICVPKLAGLSWLEFLFLLKEHPECNYGAVNEHSTDNGHEACIPSDDRAVC